LAVKLRLRRMGKKKQPIYKVVAADSRSPRDGKFIEAIGLYNPKTDPATVEIKEARAMYWLGVGAQPTDTVKNLLSQQGIILKRELAKQGLNEEQITLKLDEWKKLKEASLEASLKKKSEKAKAKKLSVDKQDKIDGEAEAKGTASE
jgi:small subunit ribosomal protein S16